MDRVVQKQTRMKYWDVAKGITILLVIMAHMPEVPVLVKHMIYTFHMPFFFLANAFFIKHYDLKVHVIKSAKSLLLPYAVVCMLEALCYAIRGNTDVYWSYDIVRVSGERVSGLDMTMLGIFWDKIADMFVGISFTSTRFKEFESVWIVWFLVTLFAAKMMYVVIRMVIRKCCKSLAEKNVIDVEKYLSLGVLLALSFTGMFIGQKYAFLPWSFDVALVSLPFFWVGEEIRASGILEKKFVRVLYVVSFVVWLILASMGIYSEMALRSYPGYVLSLVVAVAGSVVVVGIAQFLANKWKMPADFFAWCGENSIVILGIHCLEHRFFDWNLYVNERMAVQLHWSVLFIIHAILIVGSSFLVVECKRIITNFAFKKRIVTE